MADRTKATVAKNVARSLTSASGRREAASKVRARVDRRRNPDEPAQAKQWCWDVASDADEVVGALHPELWAEANRTAEARRDEARDRLGSVARTLGGGGDDRVLWYVCRLLQPEVVVETGVAAGFTAAAMLDALEENGRGHLWSSDLPNLHIEDNDQRIGQLVPDALRHRWTLLLDGDRSNLPAILDEVPGPIEVFAYDSDKSVRGREYAMDLVWPHLADDAVIVVDDVNDNWHFRDWASSLDDASWWVFRYDGKFTALVVRGRPLAERLGPSA